jgi:hypothetical protein
MGKTLQAKIKQHYFYDHLLMCQDFHLPLCGKQLFSPGVGKLVTQFKSSL